MKHSQCPDLHIAGARATITLQRPAQANRLELSDLEVLERHMQLLKDSEGVRVVILQSTGRHFCSGFHIESVPDVDAPALFERLCEGWEALPQVTIACLHAGLWGGATDLALASDMRIGTPRCVMAVPAARLGLHYHAGGMQRLISRMGLGPAKRLLLGGQTFDADTMLRTGFLDELAADEASMRALADQWAGEVASLAPLALRAMKRHLNKLAEGKLDARSLRADQKRCAESADLAEGIRAWRAKVAPHFRGA